MKRKLVSRSAIAAAIAAMLFSGIATAHAQADAPAKLNIVLFISDDNGWTDAFCYGNAVVRTPNVDRLAREGMRFTLAFAGSPTCTPSRSVMYTGLMPQRNGAHSNHSEIRPGTRAMPYYLKALGYRVVLAGKKHIEPLDQFGFEYEDARVPDDPDFRRYYRGEALDTDAVDSVLADHVAHHKEQPLCLVIAAWAPHVVWRYKDYDPSEVIVPPYLVDSPVTRDKIARYYSDITLMDERLGACLASLEKHGLADSTMFVYTSDQGTQFPHAKWNLYDAGIHTPLIVRWPGRVEPGTTTDALVSLVDLLPTFIAAAGGTEPIDIDGRSFLPVVLGDKTEHRDVIFATHTGDGRMNDSPAWCIRTRTHKYIANLKPENVFTTHISKGADRDGLDYWREWLELAKTDERAARIIDRDMHRPAEELYDLRTDPHEQQNIAGEAAHASLLSELRSQLQTWREQQGDHEGE